jgi:hypothetical protein
MDALAQHEEIPRPTAPKESLYRTQWLMAHNRLHAIAHTKDGIDIAREWEGYLAELRLADEIASKPA